jgi:two-component system, sensor histidine kinase PdtaS
LHLRNGAFRARVPLSMLVELLRRLKPIRGLPIWLRYLATTIIVLACFGLRFLISGFDDYGHLPLFLMFVPAVIIASFLFDRGSGFVAVGLSAVLGLYFYVEPAGSFGLRHLGEVFRLIVFIIVGVLTASIIEALRVTVDELAARTEELSSIRDSLVESNRHRELLLADINHRVKNHLSAIAATIVLRRKQLEDPEGQDALDAIVGRLSVLGRVYTRLDLQGAAVDLDSKEFLEGLCNELAETIVGLRPIAIVTDIEPIRLGSQTAVTLGLVVNELITNALKYAFLGDQAGEIRVMLRSRETGYLMEVRDNGVGATISGEGGTGARLIRGLVGQMRGSVEWANDGGTRVTIRLPGEMQDR